MSLHRPMIISKSWEGLTYHGNILLRVLSDQQTLAEPWPWAGNCLGAMAAETKGIRPSFS